MVRVLNISCGLGLVLALSACGAAVDFSKAEVEALSAPAQQDEPPTLEMGKVVAYGHWDFGQTFGGDIDMCAREGQLAYDNPSIGCKIANDGCENGVAVATRILDVFEPWHDSSSGFKLATPAEIVVLAEHYNVSPDFFRQEMIRVWEYRCIE